MIPNIDTLVIGFDVKNYDNAIENFVIELEKQKEKSRNYLYENTSDKAHVAFGNIDFEIMPNGARCYAYLLHNDLIELKLARGRSGNKSTLPIVIKYKSNLLWEKGLNAYFYGYDLIYKVFGEIMETKISRVDMALHIDSLEFNLSDIDSFVGKFNKDSIHRCNRNIETLYFGSRKTQKVLCRIYNKSREILETRDKYWFFDIWSKNGLDVSNVWNLEFELHRDFLREIKVNTFEELIDNLKGMWEYLTHEWIRYIDKDSATRKTRCKLQDFWKTVQHGYDSFDMDGHIQREVQRLRDSSKYVPSAVGYLTSLSALVNINDVDEAIDYLRFVMNGYLHKKKASTFEDEVDKKKKYYTELGWTL